tara:strand:+ start:197 stop:421 length:225 start_codon:yes stop_codon:yes gene_type:complete
VVDLVDVIIEGALREMAVTEDQVVVLAVEAMDLVLLALEILQAQIPHKVRMGVLELMLLVQVLLAVEAEEKVKQ